MPNSILDTFTDDDEMVTMKWFEQSLQQTEWDVEIEMEEYLVYALSHVKGEIPIFRNKPKLDSNGCLILKRI
jgi:hypothetical protein